MTGTTALSRPRGGPPPGARPGRAVPPASAALFLVTAAVTAAQFAHPALLGLLRRDPGGGWWRTGTALLVQSPPWQAVVTVPAVALLGVPAERAYGSARTLGLYLAAGLAGMLCGVAWQPHGAGNSVADCGLLGALIAKLLLEAPRWPRTLVRNVRIWAVLVLAGAVADVCLRDVHGLPVLLGAALGAGHLLRRRPAARPRAAAGGPEHR
jgi:rhomboid protease GluP